MEVEGWGDVDIVEARIQLNSCGYTSSRLKEPAFIPIEIHQVVTGTTGNYLWPSSVILSRYLLGLENLNVESKSKLVLDLGAGCGLTSISLLLKGYNVIAMDRLCSLENLTHNFKRFRENVHFYLKSKTNVVHLCCHSLSYFS